MEYQIIMKLRDTASDNIPKYNTKKWVEVYEQSAESYNINKKKKDLKLLW